MVPYKLQTYSIPTDSQIYRSSGVASRLRGVMESFVFIVIILTSIHNNNVVFSSTSKDYDIRDLLRMKRSLLFPNPLRSETKVQVLFGLGLPMEGEVSMTLGYVLKCNYDLPYNVSDFTGGPYVRYARESEQLEKPTRPKPSSTVTESISRWSLYRILQMAMNSRGSSGKACMLRAVCEAAETPFRNGRHGLLAELLHVILTPSTTHEEYEIYSDREYRAAEVIGQHSYGDACRLTYPECIYSPLDYFTKRSGIFIS